MPGDTSLVDEELLRNVRDGDVASFTLLVEQYKPIIFRWAMGLIGDGDEADDITQEVFVVVYQTCVGSLNSVTVFL